MQRKHDLHHRVRYAYTLAIGLTALLIIGALLAFQLVLHRHNQDAERVNIAGQQGMLSQKVALHISRLQHITDEQAAAETRAALTQDIETLEQNHWTLIGRKPDAEGGHSFSKPLYTLYFEGDPGLHQKVLTYLSEARLWADPARSAVADTKPFTFDNAQALLLDFKQGGAVLVRESNAFFRFVWQLTLGIGLLLLVVLAAEVFYLFRPMEAYVADLFVQLRREQETVNALNAELESQIEERSRQLAATNDRMAAVFETAIDAVIVIDENGLILDFNRAAQDLFGWEREELIGQDIALLTSEPHRAQHNLYLKNYKKTGIKKIIGSVRHLMGRHRDGHDIPLEISIGESHLGEERFFVGTLRDIGERLTVEQQLRQSEQKFREVFEKARDGIIIMRPADGTVIDANQTFGDILGFTREEVLAMSDAVRANEIFQRITDKFRRIAADQEVRTRNVDFPRRNGDMGYFDISAAKLMWGDEILVFAHIRDVTEWITTQHRLERYVRGLNLANEAGGIGIWSWDIESNDMEWDAFVYRLLGLSPASDAPHYAVWRDHIDAQDLPVFDKHMARALIDKSRFDLVFRMHRAGDDAVFWVRVASHLELDGQDVARMFGVVLDVTEERLAKQALKHESEVAKQANEAKSQFLAAMSHEIRTPMNGILGLLEILSLSNLDPHQRNQIKIINDSARSLLHILNDILDFSKIEAGKVLLHQERVDLRELMESIASLMASRAFEKNLHFDLFISPNVAETYLVDGVRVRQVLMNLLSNALKFTADGSVSLRLEASPPEHNRQTLKIIVEDTGIGISDDNLAKLFSPFTQAEATTTRRYGGTGLGLVISLRLIKLMGGRIDLNSKEGCGTRVTITLDLPIIEPVKADRYFEGKQVLVFSDAADEIVATLRTYMVSYKMVPLVLPFEGVAELTGRIDQIRPRWVVYTPTVAKRLAADQGGLVACNRFYPLSDIFLTDEAGNQGHLAVADGCVLLSIEPLHPTSLRRAFQLTFETEDHEDLREDCHMTNIDQRLSLEAVTGKFENQPMRVLVLEDHPTNQHLIRQQLSILGLACDVAKDGVQGLERLQKEHYDLVLSDVHMPEMDGFEFAGHVRRMDSPVLSRIPIIALTASALTEDAERCTRAGMNDYIAKPSTLEQLAEKISAWVSPPPKTAPMPISGERPFDVLFQTFVTHEKVLQVLDSFHESNMVDLTECNAAFHGRDADALRRIAHRIKGACSYIGDGTLLDRAVALEEAARAGDWSSITERYRELLAAFELFDVAVDALRHNQGGAS